MPSEPGFPRSRPPFATLTQNAIRGRLTSEHEVRKEFTAQNAEILLRVRVDARRELPLSKKSRRSKMENRSGPGRRINPPPRHVQKSRPVMKIGDGKSRFKRGGESRFKRGLALAMMRSGAAA